MRHDATIPPELHSGAGASVKEALGAFWSTVFRDQELVDATVSARVLSACQAYIDAMEALSLRDHANTPTFHREHWHPLLVRLSERNTGCGLVLGMEGDPQLGPQPPGTIFRPDEVFVVGGNAEFSKVNTYPLDPVTRGGLVSVGTCICDSIAEPEHVLVSGRDFELRGDVLLVRKEHDPFEAGGYRVVGEGDDRVAVLWLCDAEFDRDHVGDFLGYPLGFDVKSTPESARMLSAMWDAVVYGLTPLHLNKLLGALFGIPVLARDSVVESVSARDGVDTVVTDDAVYQVPSAVRAACVVAGASLPAGTFLTDEIAVYHGLSRDEVGSLIDGGKLTSLVLPAGSVAGVDADVELANADMPVRELPSGHDDDPWFPVNGADSSSSALWTAVAARTTAESRRRLCASLSGREWHANLFSLCDFAAHKTACKPYADTGTVTVDVYARTITLRRTSSGGSVYTKWARTSLAASGMMGFPVVGGVSYTASCDVAGTGALWWLFFGADGAYVSSGASESSGVVTDQGVSRAVTAPSNARYMALFFHSTSSAVFSRVSVYRTDQLPAGIKSTVNPLRALGYLALANTVLVYTTKDPLPGMCSEYALDVLRRLMPSTGSVQVVRTETIAGASSVAAAEVARAAGAGRSPAPPDSSVAMSDDVGFELRACAEAGSRMEAASDDVAVRFIPDPLTEV